MSRWIDADELIRYGKRGTLVYWEDIEDAPSIDIVRCAECKYWEKGKTWSACTFWTGDIYEQAAVEADDFCSYGERKDEPQTERSDT